MSLIFTESFDSGLTASQMLASGKWNSNAGIVTAGTGRNGTACLHQYSNGSLRKDLPAAQAHATTILGFAWQVNGAWPASSNADMIVMFGDSGTTHHLTLQYYRAGTTPNKDIFRVYRGSSGTGTLIATQTTPPLLANTWYYLELKVTISDTMGALEFRIDGVPAFTPLTNFDTKNAGTLEKIDRIDFVGWTAANSCRVDDVYMCNGAGTVNNDFLGDVRIECITPNADGANNGLTARSVNRLPNINVSGFETDMTDWTADTNSSIVRVTSPVHSGSGACKLTATAAGTGTMKTVGGTSGIPVIPSTYYTVGAYVYNSNNWSVPLYAGIDWYDQAGVFISRPTLVYTGVNGNNSAWQFGQGAFQSPANAAYASAVIGVTNSGGMNWNEIDNVVFAEGSTIPAGVYPTGVSTHYTAVNELVASVISADNSYVVGQTDDLLDTWTHSDLASATTQPVKGLMVWAYARSDTTSPKNMALVARTAGGTEALSADQVASQTYGMVGGVHELDPADAAWTVASVNAAEFGVQIRPG